MTEATPEDWHGTISGYFGKSCRCADCKEANRRYYHEVVKLEPRKPCQVEGCTGLAAPRNRYCHAHRRRLQKTGSFGSPVVGVRNGDGDSYEVAHARVRRIRGNAKGFPCVGCGGPAYDWAYIHGSLGERPAGTARNGRQHGPYSLNPDEYQPMCKTCHKNYDLDASGKAAHRCPTCGQRVREAS